MAYSESLWKEAKKKCRLNNEDIKIAKELGLNPKSLIKNIPNDNEQWKAPVKVWIREIYEKRKKKAFLKKKAKGMISREQTLSLQDILNDCSDAVKIYSIGSCNPTTRNGKYYALLVYKSRFKIVTGELTDTTANRCLIQGLIHAVKLLKKPCKVFLITSTPTGIKSSIRKGKGINYDILNILHQLLLEKECDAEFVALEGEGDKLNSFIFSKVQLIQEEPMDTP